MLKLEANVSGTKKVKSQLRFSFISKKKRSVKALLRKLEVNRKEICDQAKINDEIKIFFEQAFKCYKVTNRSQIFLTF